MTVNIRKKCKGTLGKCDISIRGQFCYRTVGQLYSLLKGQLNRNTVYNGIFL